MRSPFFYGVLYEYTTTRTGCGWGVVAGSYPPAMASYLDHEKVGGDLDDDGTGDEFIDEPDDLSKRSGGPE
jgi:hypothetical protein